MGEFGDPKPPEAWDTLSGWLNDWLTADPADRERLRAELATQHPELAAEAETLACSSTRLQGFLETPALVLEAQQLALEDGLLAPDSSIGPYRIVRLLARGGMGDVYHATDERLHRAVALKVLAPARSDDPQRLERFMQEARLTASLDHPNVLRVYDVGRSEGRAFLVAELLSGETLRARLAHGPMNADTVGRLAIEIARGLGAAHEAGLVHRDLKPENIFLTSAGAIKILDFGIAKLTQDDAARDGCPTLTGVVLGTAGYLAPEQIRGERVDAAADLFGLGAVMFEMLTSTRAFARNHLVETLYAILHEPPAAALGHCPGVPPSLAAIVMRLLEKSPEARFQSCAQLIDALERADMTAVRASPREAHGDTRIPNREGVAISPEPGRTRRRAAAAIFGLATLAAAMAWYGRDPAEPRTANAALGPAARGGTGAATSVIRAEEAYLRGRAYVLKPTQADLSRAVAFFEEAVALDHGFADAWAGLASAYRRMPVGGDVLPAWAFEHAKKAASQALAIDAEHAEAHAVLGTVAFWYEWDYTRAEQLLRRALTLQPDSADSEVFLAHLNSNLGRHEEALSGIRKARALDPGWPVPRSLEGQFLFMAGRHEEALERLDALVQAEPQFSTGHLMRMYPLIALRRYGEAMQAGARALDLRRGLDGDEKLYSWWAGLHGFALARLGRVSDAQRMLDEMHARAESQYVSPYAEALVLHALGRDEAALQQLQAAIQARDHRVTFLAVDSKWDELRRLPEFRALLTQVNLLGVHQGTAR